MHISELDYELPPELIAQHPVEPRDASRLLVCDRATQTHQHRHFYDLPEFLRPGDLLVANDTSVINARLHGRKPTGGQVEVLLLRKLDDVTWEALVGGRNVRQITFPAGEDGQQLSAEVVARSGEAAFVVRFSAPIEPHLDALGETPLPPYIREQLRDPARYQTVYARVAGSAAAPTAGLHFTPQLLERIQAMGVQIAFVTLHVGLDTFKPIEEETVEAHKIHTEWCELPPATAEAINDTRARGRRIIAVGTTSARVLESGSQTLAQASHSRLVQPFSGFTSLYITPGYKWKVVDALITNFHLPRSTLLAMIGAFMGMDFMRRTYARAIRERYRFYSFGDAMLIL
ncbi:MAG: tRNA preQ1(34) S-adenosylmethionine ribosyltransferase-isomerase QueA [Chloroflexi bacterium]|jgi:S-adenosylmethionine:tRNA ribosyltransferase-isomerase|uniref:S-adenosylmethionine:tRNA ribosyltransferase-isomerase n=1 Tax=Candidatus Thermofonsia Clade 3 bacterium TaxID=2364212 RepID=A0A2M8QEP7_9CHLR|nr:tRNA preQ1(34) S-adenosylmethionine ribosyltransferase-isomerase QueA [Candidatus Roseilinea sp. NK_OTU-006]PJF48285.1 MAG: tRNA preQ1(34) S-adenosylmethionine ribosyltransferase-isomerase QueA [Candidatus Thermofonsia Clade 3 bacterium]RMG66275.1 MAG: tRNA preQ1(34) S-adenosylmethionine ribosyltransferase-isomerase QueA [Chloroflexota bacterium]